MFPSRSHSAFSSRQVLHSRIHRLYSHFTPPSYFTIMLAPLLSFRSILLHLPLFSPFISPLLLSCLSSFFFAYFVRSSLTYVLLLFLVCLPSFFFFFPNFLHSFFHSLPSPLLSAFFPIISPHSNEINSLSHTHTYKFFFTSPSSFLSFFLSFFLTIFLSFFLYLFLFLPISLCRGWRG